MAESNGREPRAAAEDIITPSFLRAGLVTAGDTGHVPDEIARIYRIHRPARQTLPIVVASPHSGRHYPADLIEASRLSPHDLRSSEDSFMDEILAGAVEAGAPLLTALFPRVYVDVNREPYELDPRMFAEPLPPHVVTDSIRIAAGLGTIARVVSNAEPVYRRKLSFAEAEARIAGFYAPYHRALRQLIAETVSTFGFCLLVDGHSMPSSAVRLGRGERRPIDIVLGDCHGAACDGFVTATAERHFGQRQYLARRNSPYAGGFVTRHYGRPKQGVHALQIEINRALYMDERRIERGPGIDMLRHDLTDLFVLLGGLASRLAGLPVAAE